MPQQPGHMVMCSFPVLVVINHTGVGTSSLTNGGRIAGEHGLDMRDHLGH